MRIMKICAVFIGVLLLFGACASVKLKDEPVEFPILAKFEYHKACWGTLPDSPTVLHDFYQLYDDDNAPYNERVWLTTVVRSGFQSMQYVKYYKDRPGLKASYDLVGINGGWELLKAPNESLSLFKKYVPEEYLFASGHLRLYQEYFTCETIRPRSK